METSRLLINEPPLMILPSLAKDIGLNESIIIQQLHYWISKSTHLRNGITWIYNTYYDWHKQFPFWSISTIKRTISSLEKKGLIVSNNFNELKIDQTKWYTIDYTILNQWTTENERPLAQNDSLDDPDWDIGRPKMSSPLPETTTETTTENIKLHSRTSDEVPSECVQATQLLKEIVQSNKNVKITPHQISQWKKDIDKLNRLNQVSYERIINALKIYQKHVGENFWVVIESGRALRDKFTKLESKTNEVSRTRERKPFVDHTPICSFDDDGDWIDLNDQKVDDRGYLLDENGNSTDEEGYFIKNPFTGRKRVSDSEWILEETT